MKFRFLTKALCAFTLASFPTALVAETMVLNADDGNGRIVKITSPDQVHLDPDSVIVAIDVFGDEDREVNGVLFQTDKTDDNTVGKVERDGVTVDLTSTHFIDGWAAAPAFNGGDGNSAENLAAMMEDIRWSQAPNPLTMDVSGLDAGGLYEIQILVNEGADRDRHWDIGVNDVLVVDDFTSEGTNEDPDVYDSDNSFVYVGEFEASPDGELNVVMQQHIGGQDQMGADNNPILQAFIVHALNTSDDNPNVLAGSRLKFGQVAAGEATVRDLRIRNTGPTAELVISNAEITGPDAAHFSVVNDFPVNIPPDTKVDGDPEPKGVLQVSFDSMGRAGAFLADLVISSNDETEATQTVALSASVINRLGPQSHLKLDESAGSAEVLDSSGNENNGVVLAPAGAADLGQDPGLASGTGVKVSGGGEIAIEGGNIETLDNFSISLWLQLDSVGAGPGTVFAKGNVDTPAFALLTVGTSLGWLPEEAGENPEFLANEALTEGEKHHIAVVHDNTAGARSVTIYVDGTAVAMQEDPISINDDSSLGFQFGSYNGGLPLDAQFDDIQVYDRAIDADEIAQLIANAGQPLPFDGKIDSDGDGLDDDREAELGTNPLVADTDEDGLPDGAEVDTHNTDPLDPDSDGDTFLDGFEVANGHPPLDGDAPVIDDFLLVHYDFEDGAGTSAANNGKEGGAGELKNPENGEWRSEGSPSLGGAGYLYFSGDGAGEAAMHVDTGLGADTLGMTEENDYTATAWVNVDNTTGDHMVFGQVTDGNPLHHGTRGTQYYMGHWGNDINSGSVTVVPGEWHHVAWRYQDGVQAIFVDGVLANSGAQGPLQVAENVVIGATHPSENRDFAGGIDEVRIYNVALSGIAIASLVGGGDSDGDGLDDGWERANFGNLDQTADGDPDGDNISNTDELAQGTHPNLADTDGDGLNDDVETETDPLDADSDNDGLLDGEEVALGTDPNNRDTDGDIFGDGFEVAEGTDPLDPNSPGDSAFGPIEPKVTIGKLDADSLGDLVIHGRFTHAVNVAETGEDVQVGDINFVRDTPGPDNIEIVAQNHIEDWGAANNFGAGPDAEGLAKVASGIRWSAAPESVLVTLKDVAPGAYRLQMIFGEKCCARGFAVTFNDEVLDEAYSPNEWQEGDHGGTVASYFIYEFNQETAGDIEIDLNGTDAGFSDGNAILSGVSLQFVQPLTGTPTTDPSPHLIGYWPADDAAGTVVANVLNESLNGTLNEGTWTASGEGHTGEAGDYAFDLTGADGGGSNVEVPPTGVVFEEITITGWVKGVHTGDWSGLIQARGGTPIGIGFRGGTGELTYTWNDNSGETWDFQSGLAIPQDEWAFVALSITPEAATLYVGANGELNSAVNDIPHLTQDPGETPWHFGKDNCCGTARNFDGQMDDISIWDVALTEDELQLLFGGSRSPLQIIPERSRTVEPPDEVPVINLVSGPDSIDVSFTGLDGETYDIEYSEDLEQWEVIETGLQGVINYMETDATRRGRPAGYYRGVQK